MFSLQHLSAEREQGGLQHGHALRHSFVRASVPDKPLEQTDQGGPARPVTAVSIADISTRT